MSRTLHLIKHARPGPVPGVPAHEWRLAPGALDSVPGLAARLQPTPGLIVSSEEAKARETGQALAAHLRVSFRSMLGLHEQLRYTVPLHEDPADFQAGIARFFAHPGEVVFGEENANDARTRFGNAVRAVMLAHPDEESVAIVAHGTVMALLVAEAGGLEPLEVWRGLGLLDVVTVEWPGLGVR